VLLTAIGFASVRIAREPSFSPVVDMTGGVT